VIVNGWIDWTTHIPGVPDKVYSEPNRGIGIACHSVVGKETEFQDGVPNRFLSTEKTADGRYTASAAASSMFVLRESGELIQMYPVTASTWTSGGREGNTQFWAIEAEGGLYPNYGEQLTDAAADTFIRLVTEFEDHTGLPAIPDANILQHRQIAALYGYASTACASGRYDTAWARVASGERYDDMTPEEREEHRALVTIMGGRAKLLDNAKRGNDFILGYANEQEKLAALAFKVEGLVMLSEAHAQDHETDSLSGKEAVVVFK
jgi:hypothetical protein